MFSKMFIHLKEEKTSQIRDVPPRQYQMCGFLHCLDRTSIICFGFS